MQNLTKSLPEDKSNGRGGLEDHREALGEREIEAEFALESRAVCPHCGEVIETVQVIRLLRTKVNFVSSLPRRGQVIVCSSCQSILSGALGGLL